MVWDKKQYYRTNLACLKVQKCVNEEFQLFKVLTM